MIVFFRNKYTHINASVGLPVAVQESGPVEERNMGSISAVVFFAMLAAATRVSRAMAFSSCVGPLLITRIALFPRLFGNGKIFGGKQCVRRVSGHIKPVTQKCVLQIQHCRTVQFKVIISGSHPAGFCEIDIVEIDAPCKCGLAVYDQQFPVIAVVKLELAFQDMLTCEKPMILKLDIFL